MPVFGERLSKKTNNMYANMPIGKYAGAFKSVVENILSEQNLDFFSESSKVLMREDAQEAIKEFFMQDAILGEETLEVEELEDRKRMLEAMFENDREAVLENAPIGSFNPVIGLSFPMHKNLLINNVFDNGGITKAVAESPKFTLTMETRILVGPDGEEIDMFKEQARIATTMNKVVPWVDIELALPEKGTTDIIDALDGGVQDNISIESYISAVEVTITTKAAVESTPAETKKVWALRDIQFTPGYGDSDVRQALGTIIIRTGDKFIDADGVEVTHVGETFADTISGYMSKNTIQLNSIQGLVSKVKFTARKDASNGLLTTCSARWKSTTSLVEIPEATPINITVTPEEIKDVSKLYNVNQLSKIMQMIKDILGNYKDDTIKAKLDASFTRMPMDQKFNGSINFAVKGGYLAPDPKTWRHTTFMDQFDSYVTQMLQVLNDPNMTVTVIGRTDLIRKILPVNYSFQSQGSLGPIDLQFTKTVFSSDNRQYEFLSSDKIRKGADINDLIVLLKPRGTDRVMYIIYDYQLYVANDIRNSQNPTLPAVHAFDRWKFYEYQPVQARITIENPSGFDE